MNKARNNDAEFKESGEDQTEVINATAEEIKAVPEEKVPPPQEEIRAPSNPYTKDALNEKSYTEPPPISPDLANSPIEEPTYIPPPPPPPPQEPNAPPPPPFNPEMKGLSDKDKNTAATRAADMAIQMYEWLHDLGNRAVQISDSKLDKLQKQALIDLRAPININGAQMTLYEFVNNFNGQMSKSFEVSEDFKTQVRPLLIEIFEKRGVGMTTEQQLVFIVCKDLAGKLAIAYVMIQQRKDMLKELQANSALYRDILKQRAANSNFNQGPPQPQSYPPPPAPSSEPAPVYNSSVPPAQFNGNGSTVSRNDEIILDPDEGIPGEINANSFVEKTLNPDNVKRGTVPPVENDMPDKPKRRRRNNKLG
jgi:hypothetical protein